MKKINGYAPIAPLLLALSFVSCGSPSEKTTSSNYFDLKTYFADEATRLQTANPSIRKTVSIDGAPEEKAMKIGDWAKELSAFTDADINKAAWRGMFAVDKKNDTEQYTALKIGIPVQLLIIRRKNQKISSIEILLSNKNALYTSTDELIYYPDSLYSIKRTQSIRFKDTKTYKIRGAFTNVSTPPAVQSSAAPLP